MCGLYGIHLLLGARKRPVRCRRLEQSALHELDQGCMAVLSLIRAHHKTHHPSHCCLQLLYSPTATWHHEEIGTARTQTSSRADSSSDVPTALLREPNQDRLAPQ